MESNILNKLDALKTEYYQNNTKNRFFKNTQKNECASNITNEIDLQTLFRHTVYTIKNSNHLFFDYTVFKNYMNTNVMSDIIQYIINIFNRLIHQHGSIIFHVNMDSYSITSHERYKQIYPMFFEACAQNNIDFNKHVSIMYTYNSPKILTTLSSFFSAFMGNQSLQNVVLYSKAESKPLIDKLLS
jgi:hypothetical protein